MVKFIRQSSLYIAWLIAIVALVVSVYSSEALNMAVCHLCWYQRVCIYPLALILGVAAYCDDSSVVKYALPLAFIGMVLGIYQYIQQMIPGFAPIHLCGAHGGPDCATIHFRWLGFITYPFISFIGSFVICVLLIMASCNKKRSIF